MAGYTRHLLWNCSGDSWLCQETRAICCGAVVVTVGDNRNRQHLFFHLVLVDDITPVIITNVNTASHERDESAQRQDTVNKNIG